MKDIQQERLDFAEFMLLMGYHKGAEQIWSALSDSHPVQSHLGLGASAYRSENYTTAEDHFLEVLRIDPDHYEARLALGYTYLEAGIHEEALDHFDIAALDYPERMSTLAARGRAYARLGDFETAKSLLGQAAEVESSNYDIWIDLARCHGALRDVKPLIEAYETALQCDPRRTEAYLELTYIQILNDDFKSASRLFTLAWRDYHIRDPLLLIRAAQVEEKIGDHELAVFLIKEAAPHVQTDDPNFDWHVLWNEVFDGPEDTSSTPNQS